MLQNYFKIAWRNLLRNKISSFINIAGLAVGMTVAMLIGLWIYDEISFNQYHKNYERIAQVMQNGTYNGEVGTQDEVPPPLGKELRNVYGADFKYVVMGTQTFPMILSSNNKPLNVNGAVFEPEIAAMLGLEMLQGTRAGLQDLSSILLAESVAKAFFDDHNPIGEIIKINNDKSYTIAGVYKNLPNNSSFHDVKLIIPWNENEAFIKNHINNWGYNSFATYVQIADQADMAEVSAKVKDIKFNKVDKKSQQYKPEMFLHPMSKWHLYSEFKNGKSVGGRITYVWLFGIIGAFVLLLACINFMNLSTARSEKRAKEVGIRKAIGSGRGQLIYQFFGESFLVVAIALIVSLVTVELTLPFFNSVADKEMRLPWLHPFFWLLTIGFSLFTGFIAGSYPAFYLSSFNPIKALKGSFKVGKLAAVPRKVLVVLQFTVSVTLIIGTLIVFRQIQFAKDRPVGYTRDGLMILQTSTPDIHTHFEAIRTELKQAGAITEMAESWSPMTDVNLVLDGYDWAGKDPTLQAALGTELVSYDYGKTVGWQVTAGRDFSRDFATDSLAMILNESAVKFMGLKNPIGKVVKTSNFGQTMSFQIIGIVEDMLTESPYEPVRPFVYVMYPGKGNYTLLKINPIIGTQTALRKMEAIFKKYSPATPFDYKFVDEDYAVKFAAEERIGKLASFFAILAIFISCLGLFGLASFITEQRTKEIGIRKVLGASLLHLWSLLSKEFILLVMIALLIATPLAYYFMNNWLQNYTYRADISWWIFASAGASALLIALFTVSFQAIRAAVANPVESLHSE